MTDPFDYAKMSRRELIRHVKSYAESLHKVAAECMQWRMRFVKQEQLREFMHGGKS